MSARNDRNMAAQYDAFRQEAAFEFVDGAVRAERIDTQIVCLIQHSGQFLKQMLRFFLRAFKNEDAVLQM